MHAQTQTDPFGNAKFNHMFSEIFKDVEVSGDHMFSELFKDAKPRTSPERLLPREFVFEVAPCGLTRIVEKK